jgi:hypothetical protein
MERTMVDLTGDFGNLSGDVTDTAANLAKDAEFTVNALEKSQETGEAAPANLGLRLDMITTTLKNIRNAPALAQNVFLSYRQAEQLAAQYHTLVAEVLETGQKYGIAIGPEGDPYSIGVDADGQSIRMTIPADGSGPGEYIDSKISKLDALKNEFYLAHPFESRQHSLYARDIFHDGQLGRAMSQVYTDYHVSRYKAERESTARQADVTLHLPQRGTGGHEFRSKPSDWRSSA